MRVPVLSALIAATGLLFSAPLTADTLDVGTAALVDDSKPQRGMTMQRVESNWGQPNSRRSAVGQPPITRWEYNGFTVYFEHDRVIHTVLSRN
ncbi:MAG: hypothetical protein AAGA84_02710 [Pseudomonadota bacterium]